MSWPRVPIGDACEIVAGGTPDTDEPSYWGGDICWATPKDLSELDGSTISTTPRKLTQAGLDSCSAEVLPAGSVLFSSRAPIGHVAVNTVPMATNQGFKSFIPKPGKTDAKFLYHWLRAHRPQLEAMGNGATFKEVSKAVVERVQIPLPPLGEQKRIAEVLDKADDLRAKRRHALATLDTLLQSVFLDMFGDPVTNPKSWPMARISDVVIELEGGKSVDSDPDAVTTNRVLKVSAVTWDEFEPSESKPIPDEYVPPVEHFARVGDLLISRANTNELVGAAVYVWDTPGNVVLPDKLWRFVWAKPRRVDPLFVLAVLRHARFRHEMGKLATGTSGSMKNISKAKLMGMSIPLPPLEMQEKFSDVVKSHRSSRGELSRALNGCDALFDSLREAAFAGALFAASSAGRSDAAIHSARAMVDAAAL